MSFQGMDGEIPVFDVDLDEDPFVRWQEIARAGALEWRHSLLAAVCENHSMSEVDVTSYN